MIVDVFMLYQFLRRLTTPFNEWEAFKLGIIDEQGNVLRKRATLKDTEKKAWGYFDILTCNLKKLLATVPGGSSRIASFAAALILLREQKDVSREELLNEIRYLELALREDAPTNAVGTGFIAGTTGDITTMKVPRRRRSRTMPLRRVWNDSKSSKT